MPFWRVILGDVEGVEESVDVLHIWDIAADADNCAGVEGPKAFYVGETGERTVGCCGRIEER